MVASPKVHNPQAGWIPGAVVMEPFVHLWDPNDGKTEWNQLLRATSDVRINGHSVYTVATTVDVSHYRAKFAQELYFRDGSKVVNLGYLYSSSIGPIVFELNEI